MFKAVAHYPCAVAEMDQDMPPVAQSGKVGNKVFVILRGLIERYVLAYR